MSYQDFFQKCTGFHPYPWQIRLSNWNGKTIAVVSAPTGAGKEFGVIVPWLYSYKTKSFSTIRLVYALPTRSLVDQVYNNTEGIVEASGLPIRVYCLKGGLIEQGFEQELTEPSILIGTQDQLLSRALNRGFGVSWGQRPLHCAALTNDCRWVLDEIQLTGVAYKTLVQLYRLWKDLETFGETQLCLMSATFDDRPLKDLKVEHFELGDDDLADPVLAARVKRPKPIFHAPVQDVEEVADLVRAKHKPNSLTLVVVNTVARARKIGRLLTEFDPLIIHSRFLGFDRERIQERLKNYQGIIIATQVVEAGVDLDADFLITELCPWSSFVQRCGRCGRKRTDNDVQIYWLDYQEVWKPIPYSKEECEDTRDRLLQLNDASLCTLSSLPLPDLDLPGYLLTRREIETFFCTHPKNRDNPVTVVKYVRDPFSFTVSVVWSLERPKQIPHQRYLCPVPKEELIDFCKAAGTSPYVWGEDDWEITEPKTGDIIWLPIDAGGYSHERGWTADPHDKPNPYGLETEPEYNDPPFPFALALGVHLQDTEKALKETLPYFQKLGLPEELTDELCRCARWHDWGKAHEIWQSYAKAGQGLLAKSTKYGSPAELKGYRHELASALAALAQGASFLCQYLIAAHHGKVRDSLRPTNPRERFDSKILRGVVLGSQLPSFKVAGAETLPETKLDFPGNAGKWDKQVRGLLQEYGPFKLIYLEALIRNADIKASKFREIEARNDRSYN